MLIYLQMIESDEDRSKFVFLYKKYKGLMFFVAHEILQNKNDAEDVVHHAFLTILKNLSKISEINCPKTRSYIVIIVKRKAIDLIRSRKHETGEDYNDAVNGMTVPPPGDHGLADAIAKLPAQYRQVLLLRYDNGYSVREIGKFLGKSTEAVQKMIERAKAELRALLEKDGIEL